MQLSGQQLALLLDEVAAMIAAERPLASGLRELDTRSLGKLGRCAGKAADRIEAGEPVDVVFAETRPSAGSPIKIAFKLLESTGSIRPVQAIANWLRTRAETRRLALISMIYPLVSLTFAYLLIAFLIPWFLRQTQDTELGRPSLPTWLESSILWTHDNYLVVPLIAFGLLIVMGLLMWRRSRSSPVDTLSRWSLFSELMAIQVDAGVPLDQATGTAVEALGDQQLAERCRREGIAACGSSVPPMLRWSLTNLHRATPRLQSMELETLARFYRERARSRFGFLIEWGPLLVSTVALVVVVSLIVVVAFLPMYEQLSKVGGGS